jgi:hypothetical protein
VACLVVFVCVYVCAYVGGWGKGCLLVAKPDNQPCLHHACFKHASTHREDPVDQLPVLSLEGPLQQRHLLPGAAALLLLLQGQHGLWRRVVVGGGGGGV